MSASPEFVSPIHHLEIFLERETETFESNSQSQSTLNQKMDGGQKGKARQASSQILFSQRPFNYTSIVLMTQRVVFYCFYLL